MYPIREAARRTGLSDVQLRTWERRYGFGPSARSPGGHRRYTDADLQRLSFAAALVSTGVGTGAAAAMALGNPAASPVPPAKPVFESSAIARLRRRRVDAVAARDRAVAARDQLIRERDRLVARALSRNAARPA